jgi:purine nucleoside permease
VLILKTTGKGGENIKKANPSNSKRKITGIMVVAVVVAFLVGSGVTYGVAKSQIDELKAIAYPEKIKVKVMEFSMFEIEDYTGDYPGEFQRWYERCWPDGENIEVEGAFAPVFYNDNGVCGTIIGVGKSMAAASVTAILSDPRFDFSKAYFITSGCAGTPPSVGTVGAVFWADYVVDYDTGQPLVSRRRNPPASYRWITMPLN